MKNFSHPSDSKEQRESEKIILEIINESEKLKLKPTKLIIDGISFNLDGYSERPSVLCEIYSHIGRLKPAQKYKVANDILKMLLIEKMKKKVFRKILVFADEKASKNYFEGDSRTSRFIKYFNIDMLLVDLPDEIRDKIIEAQKRQLMINKI